MRRSDPAEREQLLAALGELAATERLDASPRAQAVVGEILTNLAVDADPDLRRKLVEWAGRGRCMPRPLALELAYDEIEVAGPVIRRSPTLWTQDLLRLIAEGAAEHQISVGRRAALERAVMEAILEQGEPAALAALASNADAPLAPEHLELLVDMSKRLAVLRAPLARRPELTPEWAQTLATYSGSAVRRMLAARFGELEPRVPAGPPEGSERRLIAKLEIAGRLSPGYALRVLREGKLTLFEHALAALAGLSHQEVRARFDAAEPGSLADACTAAGLDRSVFPLVLSKVRDLNAGRPGDADPARKTIPRRSKAKGSGAPKPPKRKAPARTRRAGERAARRAPT